MYLKQHLMKGYDTSNLGDRITMSLGKISVIIIRSGSSPIINISKSHLLLRNLSAFVLYKQSMLVCLYVLGVKVHCT